jgi:HSP20 family protein
VFDALRHEFGDVVEQLQEWELGKSTGLFAPRADVAESDEGYEISLDLPGVAAEDFELELEDGTLTIAGTRKDETNEEGKTFQRIERRHGQFRRSFALGQDVDPDKVEASYKDGVLRISVPKTEKVRPRKIEIKV